MRLPGFARSRAAARLLQAAMISPLVLMWAGFVQFFWSRSTGLLQLILPESVPMVLALIGLPAAGLLITIYRMYRRAPEKLEAGLDILLCLFIGGSMMVLLGQVFNL